MLQNRVKELEENKGKSSSIVDSIDAEKLVKENENLKAEL